MYVCSDTVAAFNLFEHWWQELYAENNTVSTLRAPVSVFFEEGQNNISHSIYSFALLPATHSCVRMQIVFLLSLESRQAL